MFLRGSTTGDDVTTVYSYCSVHRRNPCYAQCRKRSTLATFKKITYVLFTNTNRKELNSFTTEEQAGGFNVQSTIDKRQPAVVIKIFGMEIEIVDPSSTVWVTDGLHYEQISHPKIFEELDLENVPLLVITSLFFVSSNNRHNLAHVSR